MDSGNTHQLGPRYEGRLMSEPKPPSGQSSSYSLTTLSSHVFYEPTGRDGHDLMIPNVDACCAPFYCRLRRRECCILVASSSQPTVPLHEIPPARLVIHRRTMNNVSGRGVFNRGRAYWHIYAPGNIGYG